MMVWIKKQLTSKTNINVALAVLFYVLKYSGLIDTVPDDVGLSVAGIAVVNVIIKTIKTIYYKIKK